jgi:hypothetical protein
LVISQAAEAQLTLTGERATTGLLDFMGRQRYDDNIGRRAAAGRIVPVRAHR